MNKLLNLEMFYWTYHHVYALVPECVLHVFWAREHVARAVRVVPHLAPVTQLRVEAARETQVVAINDAFRLSMQLAGN